MSDASTQPVVIGRTTFSTPTDVEGMVVHRFDAPRTVVFDAWTNPAHVPQWMLGPPGWSMPVCEADVRPGGAWRYVWRRTDGSELEISGSYRDLSPPEWLVHTERWGPGWPETTNIVEFEEHDGRTRVTLTTRYPSTAERDRAWEAAMMSGFATSMERLEQYLTTLTVESAR